MASPQPTDSHTRLSNELYTQILMRPFSKRQRAILDLIIRLSYGCGHKTATIPLARNFEICGVQANKVRRELDTLRTLCVIGWDEEQRVYWLNKDYDTWLIQRPTPETESDFNELLKLNIKSAHDQNGHAQNGQDDQKGHTDMTKKVSETGPKRSCVFPVIPSVVRDDGVPITKDNYIDISTASSKKNIVQSGDIYGEIEGHMRVKMVNHQYALVGKDYQSAKVLVEEGIPLEFIVTGIDESFANYKPKGRLDRITAFSYCAPQIERKWNDQKQRQDTHTNGGNTDESRDSRQDAAKHGRDAYKVRRTGRDEDAWAKAESNFFG